MRVERRDDCWLVVGVAAPGASATTVWSCIFVRRDAVDDARLLRHELEHVRQWHEHGVARFVARYLTPYLRWRLRGYPHWAAYRRIPFEIEAEWRARRSEAIEVTSVRAVETAGPGERGAVARDAGRSRGLTG